MAAINFPDSPSNGDTHVVDGVTYTYNSAETKWKTTINSNAFLPLSGGTVSGNIVLGGELQHSGDTDTKITFGTDTINLDTAGSTRATVDSSGRLLVGTSTARSVAGVTGGFHLAGTGADSCLNVSRYSANTGPAILQFGKSRGTSDGSYTIVSNGDQLGSISFAGADGTDLNSIAANIAASVDGTPGANDMPGRLVFSTTADGASFPTERMRISSAGDVGIGNPGSANVRLTVHGVDTTSSNYAIAVRSSAGNNLLVVRNDAHFFCDAVYNQTTASGANVYIDGSARLLRSTSSLKYKTNVETLEDHYADAVLNVRPVWYQSLGVNDNPDWGWWGFIAEEVAEIDPRLVSWKTAEVVEDENGAPLERPLETPEPEGVHYDRFVPHLVNLIKRQKEQLETQGAAIAALEARLTALEGGTN
jgi:hypothetical protein